MPHRLDAVPLQENTLTRRAAPTCLTWLALLAIGVQILLPWSVGLQIAEYGSTTVQAATAGTPPLPGHAHHASTAATGESHVGGSHIHPAAHSRPTRTHHTDPAGGCALCVALQVLLTYTEAIAFAVPPPAMVRPIWRSAAGTGVPHAHSPASYQSRAPPVVA